MLASGSTLSGLEPARLPAALPESLDAAPITIIERSQPLDLAPSARGQLPSQVDVAIIEDLAPQIPKADPRRFAIEQVTLGSARIELGDGYSLMIDEAANRLDLANETHAKSTTIWGDARIGNDEKEPLQFWGKVSVEFGEEGKITLETSKAEDDSSDYRLDKVVVSNGRRGVEVTGIGDAEAENLEFSDPISGYRLDNRHHDGLLLQVDQDTGALEKANGKDVTQAHLNKTAEGRYYGPGTDRLSGSEIVQKIISRFFSGANLLTLAHGHDWSNAADSRYDDLRDADNDREFDRYAERMIVERMQFERQLELRSARS